MCNLTGSPSALFCRRYPLTAFLNLAQAAVPFPPPFLLVMGWLCQSWACNCQNNFFLGLTLPLLPVSGYRGSPPEMEDQTSVFWEALFFGLNVFRRGSNSLGCCSWCVFQMFSFHSLCLSQLRQALFLRLFFEKGPCFCFGHFEGDVSFDWVPVFATQAFGAPSRMVSRVCVGFPDPRPFPTSAGETAFSTPPVV